MKKKLIVLTILAVAVFTCVGCAETTGAGGQGTDGQSGAPGMSRSEEPDGRAEKMNVAITIDGEDYAFPMSYEEFAARGWTLSYDPELWKDGLKPGCHGGSLFFSKGDIKALEVVFNNPADTFQSYAKCEVAGIRVNYDQQINGENAELVMNIPAGSIQVNGQGIGEAGRDDIVAAFGEDAAFVTDVPADSIQINDQPGRGSNSSDVAAFLGKGWDDGCDGDVDLNEFDTFVWWLDRNRQNEGNDDTLTISFDETGVFTEMTFLKTK